MVKTDFEGECGIARKSAEINVIVYYPKTEEGKRELARRVAGVHADMVQQYIKKLDCPPEQKTQLVDAVIQTASRARTQRRAAQERDSR